MVAVVAPDGSTDKISLEHIPMTPYDKRIIVGAMIVFTVVGIAFAKTIKMGDTLRLVALIVAVTITEALGQYMLQVYHRYHKMEKDVLSIGDLVPSGTLPKALDIPLYPLATWLLYGLCTVILLTSYEYTSMGKAEVYWDALSALLVPLIGVVFLRSKINLYGWIGIFLVLTGTVMIGFQYPLGKDFSRL